MAHNDDDFNLVYSEMINTCFRSLDNLFSENTVLSIIHIIIKHGFQTETTQKASSAGSPVMVFSTLQTYLLLLIDTVKLINQLSLENTIKVFGQLLVAHWKLEQCISCLVLHIMITDYTFGRAFLLIRNAWNTPGAVTAMQKSHTRWCH